MHLLKNIRNNLLKTHRFIFPPFAFDHFIDVKNIPRDEISWKLLHDVFDKDQIVKRNLRKAHKLSYKAVHLGDNKQNMPLALSTFDPTTSSAIESYFHKVILHVFLNSFMHGKP